jgi:acyl dehydratase
MPLTGAINYFEDFAVGEVYEHSRGRTVTNFDNYALTHRSMNTAHSHFNLERAKDVLGGLPERIVAGPCTIGLVVGLTSQDMSENAFMDVAMTGLKLFTPVFSGDTLTAQSEVLALMEDPARADTGLMRYRFTGFNQHGKKVAEGERVVRLKRRSAWAQRDGNTNTQEVAT